MSTPVAEDADAIKRRIAELQAERMAARNCTCDVREDDTRAVNPACPIHGQSSMAPAAMQHFPEDDWQRLKQEMVAVNARPENLRERLVELNLISPGKHPSPRRIVVVRPGR